jgi:ParB family chromosome partitioning protein
LGVADHSSLELSISAIHPNPHQPRKQFSEASLAELAASLQSTGLIQPIIVRKVGDHFELIAGERRWRAAKLAGLQTIPALVRDVDGMTQAQMALVENIQRENLNPLDRAAAYQSLLTQLGVTQTELATRLGEDRSSIANHLRLLELAEPVRNRIAEGVLSLGHAKVLASIQDKIEQERLAELCVSQGLSVRNLERLLTNATPVVKTKSDPAPSPHIQDVEKSVARQLGMRVQLRSTPGQGRGRLVIHYASLDQFDELLQRMGIQLD